MKEKHEGGRSIHYKYVVKDARVVLIQPTNQFNGKVVLIKIMRAYAIINGVFVLLFL